MASIEFVDKSATKDSNGKYSDIQSLLEYKPSYKDGPVGVPIHTAVNGYVKVEICGSQLDSNGTYIRFSRPGKGVFSSFGHGGSSDLPVQRGHNFYEINPNCMEILAIRHWDSYGNGSATNSYSVSNAEDLLKTVNKNSITVILSYDAISQDLDFVNMIKAQFGVDVSQLGASRSGFALIAYKGKAYVSCKQNANATVTAYLWDPIDGNFSSMNDSAGRSGCTLTLGSIAYSSSNTYHIRLRFRARGDGEQTASKCSSLGFIATKSWGNETKSFILSSSDAYDKTGEIIDKVYTFKTGDVTMNTALYFIINNQWAAGYDNQTIDVYYWHFWYTDSAGTNYTLSVDGNADTSFPAEPKYYFLKMMQQGSAGTEDTHTYIPIKNEANETTSVVGNYRLKAVSTEPIIGLYQTYEADADPEIYYYGLKSLSVESVKSYADSITTLHCISFDKQSGTGTANNIYFIDREAFDADAMFPKLSRTHYTFSGWRLATKSTRFYNDWLSDNVTLYALWTPVTYYITYDLSNVQTDPPITDLAVTNPNRTSYNVETQNFYIDNPSRANARWSDSNNNANSSNVSFIFKGWTVSDSRGISPVNASKGGNFTLTANWIQLKHILYGSPSMSIEVSSKENVSTGTYTGVKKVIVTYRYSFRVRSTTPTTYTSIDWHINPGISSNMRFSATQVSGTASGIVSSSDGADKTVSGSISYSYTRTTGDDSAYFYAYLVVDSYNVASAATTVSSGWAYDNTPKATVSTYSSSRE